MLRIPGFVAFIILAGILTFFTQIGGIVLALSACFYPLINSRLKSRRFARASAKVGAFAVLYLVTTFLVVPPIARRFGRVPLPVFETNHVKPGMIWTCFMNRHYLRPQLKAVLFEVAGKMSNEFPGTTINYLDTGFPFINGFPLPPHISHNDGKKLDLSFTYRDAATGDITNDIPSYIGYGVCEEPAKGEQDRPAACAAQGYRVYNFMQQNLSQKNKPLFTFDAVRTKRMTQLFANDNRIGKMFLEPHLIKRLKLKSEKLRLHGCYSVRHDDHLHVQLR